MEDFSDEPMVVVYETTDEVLADALLAAIEDAGLVVSDEIDRTSMGDGLGFGVVGGPFTHLLVPESQAEEAKKIVEEYIRAFESGELKLTDLEESEIGEEEEEEFDEE